MSKPAIQLQFGTEFPTLPFVDKVYPIQLFLVDSRRQLVTNNEAPIDISIYYNGSENPLPIEELCTIEPAEPKINSKGCLDLKISFQQVSMTHSNKKFQIKFSIKSSYVASILENLESDSSLESETISPLEILTIPLLVIRYRLIIQIDNNTLRDEQNNIIWYKDEGGKDHGIDMLIKLLDQNNNLVTAQEIPFIISLHYHNQPLGSESTLSNSLLTILPEPTCIIEKSSGSSHKKLRVNDISKNHQRQLFSVHVNPDVSKSPLYYEIAGDFSDPIEVRSKRTKRQREGTSQPAASSSTNGKASVLLDNSIGINGLQTNNGINLQKKPKSDIGSPSIYGAAVPVDDYKATSSENSTFVNNEIQPNEQPRNTNNSNNISQNKGSTLQKGGKPSNEPENDVDKSLTTVLKWVELILSGLQDIRWKPIGFQSLPDGNIDTSQPLYHINNPNSTIDKILREYSTSVYQQLSFIVKRKESFSGPQTHSTSSSQFPNGHFNQNNNNSNSNQGPVSRFLRRPAPNASIAGQRTLSTGFNRNKFQTNFGSFTQHSSNNNNNNSNNNSEYSPNNNLNNSSHSNDNSYWPEAVLEPGIGPQEWDTSIPNIEEANTKLAESLVFYIVSKPYPLHTTCSFARPSPHEDDETRFYNLGIATELYFPAYDMEKELIGFYIETKDDRGATVVRFLSLVTFPIDQLIIDVKHAKKFLLDNLIRDATNVYSLEKFGYKNTNSMLIPSNNTGLNQINDIQSMKHDAIVHYWLSEVGLDEF